MKTGNDLWWSQVQDLHTQEGGKRHYQEVEADLFYQLYKIMKEDNMTSEEIRLHFKETFGLGYSAFYTRVNWMRRKYVI